ncbi:MAG TPA: hypothetical protein VHX68_04880, partial [Planctomycetaceae bacterium]|nr:hypothetical protein [Planctomycetaceae bacterium]
MLFKKLSCLFALSVCTLGVGGHLLAADKDEKKAEKKSEEKKADDAKPLEEMDADTAKEYGGMIAQLFAKSLKNPQVKIEGDVDKATGLVNLTTREGIIAIPIK